MTFLWLRSAWCRHVKALQGLLLIGCLFSAASSVRAGELGLILNGKALHHNVPSGHDYNEENWGAGLKLRVRRVPG